jgi:hypothetical protein
VSVHGELPEVANAGILRRASIAELRQEPYQELCRNPGATLSAFSMVWNGSTHVE